MRKTLFTIVAVVLAANLVSTSVFAASPAFCQQYAAKAVWAESQNIADACGFVGPRWSFDFAGHYAWCLLVPKSVANSEKNARKWMLAGC